MDLKTFAKQRKHLFWYIKDTDNLSQDSIVEHILNYGNWKDFKELISIMGIDNVARIFRAQIEKQRNNYRPKIKHYFELYFNEHAK
ncbi:MAG TPA: hypothetical protein PKI00_02695 [Candidatus Pacearchaeota archaeon]|nr:hypothetical protein [Candidatus Parcubacteria bacterium]HNP79733.1 hypothetical protein [Candidatus Pacearchaeota archaeon]HQM24451.1 hypothetical protein [Candidatus Pacearchaeota archaeon]